LIPLLNNTMKKKGQSLQEYMLTGVLVVLATTVGLSLVGNNQTILVSKIFTSPIPHVKAPDLVITPQTSPTAGNGSATTIDLGNGQVITLGNFVTNSQTLYETAGANGVTLSLAAQIQQFAKALFDAGQITQTELDDFTALSNQGHRIASILQVLENVPSVADGYSTKVVFEGNEYLLNDLGQMIGVKARFDESGQTTIYEQDLTSDIVSTGPESAQFLKLFKKISTNASFSNPAISGLVTALSKQILEIADTYESNIFGVAHSKSLGNKVPDNYLTDTNFLSRLKGSALAHGDSVVICSMGNGASGNNSCH
jgi:hypothetical protein